MVTRTKSRAVVDKAIESYADRIEGLDVEQWLNVPGNLALTDEDGNVAMFERQYRKPDTVCGHYFFTKARGRAAINTSKEMLEEVFTGPYNVKVVVGLTPLDNKGALWMNRQLGFKEHGDIDASTGPCKFVMLTKNEWEEAR